MQQIEGPENNSGYENSDIHLTCPSVLSTFKVVEKPDPPYFIKKRMQNILDFLFLYL